jgi:hypothetical protein
MNRITANCLLLAALGLLLVGCQPAALDPLALAIESDLACVRAVQAVRKPLETAPGEGGRSVPPAPPRIEANDPPPAAPPPPAPTINWRPSYAAALTEQQATGRPILLWFHLPTGCALCVQQQQLVHPDPDFRAAAAECICVAIDGRASRDFAGNQFGVNRFPQSVLLLPSGVRRSWQPSALPTVETARLRAALAN